MDVWAAKHAPHPEGCAAFPFQFANYKEGNPVEMSIFLCSFDVRTSLELHIGAALQIVQGRPVRTLMSACGVFL